MQRKNTTINSVLEVISFKDNSWKFCYFKKVLTIKSILKKKKKNTEFKDFILPSNQKELFYEKESKRLLLTLTRVPIVLHCPKSLVLKSLHRVNTLVARSVTSIALCPINWVNILPILSLFF